MRVLRLHVAGPFKSSTAIMTDEPSRVQMQSILLNKLTFGYPLLNGYTVLNIRPSINQSINHNKMSGVQLVTSRNNVHTITSSLLPAPTLHSTAHNSKLWSDRRNAREPLPTLTPSSITRLFSAISDSLPQSMRCTYSVYRLICPCFRSTRGHFRPPFSLSTPSSTRLARLAAPRSKV